MSVDNRQNSAVDNGDRSIGELLTSLTPIARHLIKKTIDGMVLYQGMSHAGIHIHGEDSTKSFHHALAPSIEAYEQLLKLENGLTFEEVEVVLAYYLEKRKNQIPRIQNPNVKASLDAERGQISVFALIKEGRRAMGQLMASALDAEGASGYLPYDPLSFAPERWEETTALLKELEGKSTAFNDTAGPFTSLQGAVSQVLGNKMTAIPEPASAEISPEKKASSVLGAQVSAELFRPPKHTMKGDGLGIRASA